MYMTTASTTKFCREKIEGPGGFHLWIDGNQKITAGNGTYEDPSPNAFSLVQIKDCPGSTPTCRAGCYVHNLEKHASDTHAMYQHNSEEIRHILASPYEAAWSMTLGAWIAENCQGGFRWHVSGDVFSQQYAEWIVAVCQWSANVKHWIYTRSFDTVWTLIKADNLVVNLSADKDNIPKATEISFLAGNPNPLRICYYTQGENLPVLCEGDVIFPDYALRGSQEWWDSRLNADERKMVCPVDYFGKSESIRCGVCKKCM